MKRILYFLFLLFICCTENNGLDNASQTKSKNDSIVSLSESTSIKKDIRAITPLPYGYPKFFQNTCPPLGKKFGDETYMSLVDVNLGQKDIQNVQNLDIPFKPNPEFIVDYDYGIIKRSDNEEYSSQEKEFQVVQRLPDYLGYKVYVFKNKGIEHYNDISSFYLVTVSKKNELVDWFNLGHKHTPSNKSNGYAYEKEFYIDKDYLIKTKYLKFLNAEETTQSIFIDEMTYKILPNGHISQWFNQNDGPYKSELQQGEIKNHLKNDIWIERYNSGSQEAEISFKDGVINDSSIEIYRREKFEDGYRRYGPETILNGYK